MAGPTSSRTPAVWRSRPATASGASRRRSREDVPRIVAELVASGVDIYEVTVVRSTLEDAYLEAVDPELTPTLIIARHVLQESVRRRVFVIVLVLTLLFLGSVHTGHSRGVQRAGAVRRGRHVQPRTRSPR